MNRIFATATAAALAALLAQPVLAQNRPLPERHVAGRVLVQPRPGLSAEELDKIVKPHGGASKRAIKSINVHVIELPPQANAVAIAEALRKNRHVKFAEVDGVLEASLTPNDPRYPYAWHLPKIGAPQAWDQALGNGVTIAILDTGVDATHEDLASRIVAGWNFYDNNADTSDIGGHGTAVAGTAAAAGNNATGVASVGMSARIMPIRITDASGYGYYSMIADGIVHAADNGARVANVSFLGVSLSSTVEAAAQYMRSKGGVVVTSGGNTAALRNEPVSSALTVVSATDSVDAKASFSSWGDYIDIAAPGVSIWTTTKGGGYGGFSGTSAASPVVAGVYALLMSANPGLAPTSLDNLLFGTALDLGSAGKDQTFGAGRVNAGAAVQMAAGSPPPSDTQAPTVNITNPGNAQTASGLVAVDVNASDNLGVTKVEFYAKNILVATDTGTPYAFTLDTASYADGSLALQAKAYDAAGNAGTSSTVTVTVANDTTAPTVQIINPSAGATVSGTVNISVSASDDKKVSKIVLKIDGKEVMNSYGSSLSYSWSVPSAQTTGSKGKGGGGGKKGSSTTTTSGSSTISAEALDAAGNSASANVTVKY